MRNQKLEPSNWNQSRASNIMYIKEVCGRFRAPNCLPRHNLKSLAAKKYNKNELVSHFAKSCKNSEIDLKWMRRKTRVYKKVLKLMTTTVITIAAIKKVEICCWGRF